MHKAKEIFFTTRST